MNAAFMQYPAALAGRAAVAAGRAGRQGVPGPGVPEAGEYPGAGTPGRTAQPRPEPADSGWIRL